MVLGDIKLIDGKINYNGSISYVSQTPFIQNNTLRENILYGKKFDEMKYKVNNYIQDVLYSCALLPDLDVLPFGDLTEIGEKGINLSGGQRARIELARALYNDSDMYINI